MAISPMSETSLITLRISAGAAQYSHCGSVFPSLSRPVKISVGRTTPATGIRPALMMTCATSTVSGPNASA